MYCKFSSSIHLLSIRLFSFNLRSTNLQKSIRLLIIAERTMFASTFAAITAFQVIFFRKNFITLFVVVKVFVFFDDILLHSLNQNC